jgi:Secretion system C-terminal sorting domain
MKKKLLLIVALAFTTHIVNAQLINPGFETWSNDLLVPTAMQPNSGNGTYGWWDYNFFNSSSLGSSPISVIRTTDTVRTGNYSVRLETVVYTPTSWNIYKNWGIPFIGHDYNDTLGILYNGNVDVTTQTYKPGIPFTQSIADFKFYYQYNPNGNDTAECRVSLMSGGQPVAGGVFKTGVATGSSGWQQAVVNMTYVSGLTPDTLFVLFSSSSLDYDPKAGSVLWIDDASISLPTGIEQVFGEESKMTIYPNPFSISTTIKFKKKIGETYKLDVFDFTGKLVRSINNITDNQVLLSKEGLSSGIYLVQLQNNKGLINTEKIIIE